MGECGDEALGLAGVDVNVENLAMISSSLATYCDGTRVEVNADIAGPGVSMTSRFRAVG
ncbi:hypothetical protein B0T14DRAFT_508080 [Immersiella caudata]|uniref:Uncharacterized protein n=1 Tax=Immersiella caudata TaxID=314043 RepID=A0AA39XH78_9PEZI|nr:hypothetical protein B0T14DRAFT_508080 [Immersiella caudata]